MTLTATGNIDASLVNVLPRSPFAIKNVKTNGPGMAANPPSTASREAGHQPHRGVTHWLEQAEARR